MTNPSGPSVEQVRQVVEDARAMAAAVAALVDEAHDPADVAWAEHRAEYVQARLADLEASLRRGDARAFPGSVQAVLMEFRPVEDAPAALQPATPPVFAAANQLALSLRAAVDPYLVDGFLPPEIGETLRRAAGE